MFAAERRQVIADLVRAHGAISIRSLAEKVDSSEVTVRRDLQTLQEAGLIQREHGGAMSLEDSPREPTYAEKSHTASAQKARIAELAATLVRDGDALVIGAGTTTMAFAERLCDHSDLTVMTNSLLVAQAMAESQGVEVVLTGGLLRGSILALVGSAAERSLGGLHADWTFLSGNGLSVARGLSTPNQAVASIDRALVGAGREIVVLADHTKFERDSVVQTVAAGEIGHLVTDSGAPSDELAGLRAVGVAVHVAG